jgi:hypothetical protein
VRLDVDDIVINATGAAVWPQGCALAATGLNLTAVNATLLPGQSLVCSFGATPTQGAYEAGLVTVDVKAVGVAAYGTHPAIAGVIGGVVRAGCWRGRAPGLHAPTARARERARVRHAHACALQSRLFTPACVRACVPWLLTACRCPAVPT